MEVGMDGRHQHRFSEVIHSDGPHKVCACGMDLKKRTKRKAKRRDQNAELRAQGIEAR